MSQYCIYQLPVEKDYTFRGWNEAEEKFDFSDYKTVYSGELVDVVEYAGKTTVCNDNDRKVLEELYVQFNANHPSGYTGRSLSVSDIVAVIRESGTKYYYCDNFGWTEVTEKINYTKEKKL